MRASGGSRSDSGDSGSSKLREDGTSNEKGAVHKGKLVVHVEGGVVHFHRHTRF